MRISIEAFYTTVETSMRRENKRRKRTPADPGSRAVMCDVTRETYTLRVVPLVEWARTIRRWEPIVDDNEHGPQTVLLGYLDPTDQFVEEDWAEAVKGFQGLMQAAQ